MYVFHLTLLCSTQPPFYFIYPLHCLPLTTVEHIRVFQPATKEVTFDHNSVFCGPPTHKRFAFDGLKENLIALFMTTHSFFCSTRPPFPYPFWQRSCATSSPIKRCIGLGSFYIIFSIHFYFPLLMKLHFPMKGGGIIVCHKLII